MKLTAKQTIYLIGVMASALLLVLVHIFFGKAPRLAAYGIDINQTSVSGVSSGGAMAVQLHVAHSSIMRGVGVTAGVAYDCSNSELDFEHQRLAQGLLCIAGTVDAEFSITQTQDASIVPGAIDDPELNLPRQKVWLFSGYNDGGVRRAAMNALNEYYEHYAETGNVFYKNNNKAPHALVTDDWGAPCLSVGGDYINNCNYDSAGRLLQHIYGRLQPPGNGGLSGSILSFDQGEFANGDPRSVGLADEGFVFVPAACQTDPPCRAHVVFHGCQQNEELVGDAVYRNAGYNKWADANKTIVLYPQTVTSDGTWPHYGPSNPRGCWDWWGYSEPSTHRSDYARKSGYQISAVKAMLDRLAEDFGPGGGPPDTFRTPQHFSTPDSTSTSVELIWQHNTAATGFNIYRSSNSSGSFERINSNLVLGASYVDRGLEPVVAFHYKVRAEHAGIESAPTDPISVTTALEPPLCDAHYSNNFTHVASIPSRAYPQWDVFTLSTKTYALGTDDPMGAYSLNVHSHLIKIGGFNYRVGFCP